MTPQGYWMLVLHAHLPFVKHPEYEYFLEEQWLYEAISETYIPLLMNFKKLEEEGVPFQLTTSVTPPLAEMLADTMLMDRYRKHLAKMIELADKEIRRTKDDPQFNRLAHFYRDRFLSIREFFDGFLGGNVLNGYRYFMEKGNLEVITCGFTHGFLPILSSTENAVRAQIEVACNCHEKHFGQPPKGIWLPECAYFAGLDKILADNGIRFFFVDTHGILYAKPRPRYGVYAPVYTDSGPAAFARDYWSSKQVWSSKEGYPGDFAYRDFYRDAGYDLDFDYIKPYISPDGERVFTGMKYYSITGTTDHKEPYNPDIIEQKTADHAADFVQKRVEHVGEVAELMDRPPVVVSPYDAELYGHWWFEGPKFLANVFREMAKKNEIESITPSGYLEAFPTNQVASVNPSSWGDEGYYRVWLNGGNDWIYRHLHYMAESMVNFARRYAKNGDGMLNRALNQMARELFLAQSSDWAFLITNGTALEYAVQRTKEHIHNFMRLRDMVEDNAFDEGFMSTIEKKNSIFAEMDFRVFM